MRFEKGQEGDLHDFPWTEEEERKKKKKKEASCPLQSAKNPNATTLYEVSHFHYIWAYVIHYGPGFVT
jgi:hypothetical protein